MRTTIACQWCRKSKVKCHHDGIAPCRACISTNRRDCVLSVPEFKSKKRRRVDDSISSRPEKTARVAPPEGRAPHPGPTTLLSEIQHPAIPQSPPDRGRESRQIRATSREENADHAHSRTQTRELPEDAILMKACNLLLRLFPECRFIHQPTFLNQLEAGQVEVVKLWAILAVTARYIPDIADLHGDPQAAAEYCAQKARAGVNDRLFDKADADTVQILILIGLHEWGSCNSFRAWMYIGMAIRMAQALRPILDEQVEFSSSRQRPQQNVDPDHITSQECIRRTIWASFVMDCMLSGGKHRPQSFQAARLDLTLPVGEEDFAFQIESRSQPPYFLRLAMSNTSMPSDAEPFSCNDSLSIIIRGLDIWSTLSGWICAGGRRLESDSPQASPWNEASFWHRINTALLNWRNAMSARLYYAQSSNNLQVHISRGQGEPFVFINLLYYLNKVFLHREYVPFLPHRCSSPAGPIDPPLLVEKAPDRWWVANSRVLFEAAAAVVDLVRSAERRGLECRTIFASFCVYSSAITLLYAQAWPHMAPDARHAGTDYEWAFQWLKSTSRLWKMVEGWISTLETLSLVYDQIRADKTRFIMLGRSELINLEDQVNRFAEVETPSTHDRTPGGEGAAEALLTLAQHGGHSPPQLEGGVGLPIPNGQRYLQVNEKDFADSTTAFADMFEDGNQLLFESQDILASIMGDNTTDWS